MSRRAAHSNIERTGFDAALIDELARVFAHAAVDRLIAEQMEKPKCLLRDDKALSGANRYPDLSQTKENG